MRRAYLLTGAALMVGGLTVAAPGLAADQPTNAGAAGQNAAGEDATQNNPVGGEVGAGTAAGGGIGVGTGDVGTAGAGDRTRAPAAEVEGQMGASDATDQAALPQDGSDGGGRELLTEAIDVVRRMKEDGDLAGQLQQAEGVFIIPDYGRGALVAGVSGGSGVMLERQNGGWSNPAFYAMGAISAGLQAGASAGSMAMLLMSEDAVQSFKQDNQFSLNANAGLSIIDWSANAQAAAGKGDIILWSDTEGLFGGVSISVEDISFDEEESSAFYGQEVRTQSQVLASNASDPAVEQLKGALR